jgi:YidC/Oxa1 family membrane protein insertase
MNALKQAGHELSRIIDFGTFDVLAKPCLWLMNYIYEIIPNYGVAIIILTLLSKILLWPLGTKSYKSMSQMKKLQPLIQELRGKYKNDRKKMNEEIMRLHRTYSINPLGGCLPMLVQIPVFFALYRMLDQAIELRHAHFIWWINDLSAPDRLFHFDFSIPFMEPPYGIPVLTLVMGATMFWQQKMTPPAGDPTQAKMMLMMPVNALAPKLARRSSLKAPAAAVLATVSAVLPLPPTRWLATTAGVGVVLPTAAL